jgi:NSS family neurotransmitter:Na+ symporter
MSDGIRQRETWGGKLGFFLAATGSAIGLGNVWRFPTIAGENGGAAFVLIYLAAVTVIGMPVMLAELSLGWQTRQSPVRAFEKLAPGSQWKQVGWLAVFASLAIVSYYSVIASWTSAYCVMSLFGQFDNIPTGDYLNQVFERMTGNWVWAVGLLAGFVAATTLVVLGGVKNGIERWSKILMPLLLLILVLLMLRSLTLPQAGEGLAFYLSPDFSKVTVHTVLDALSQAFFSLSLGMGIMITYGSYLSKDVDLAPYTCWICLSDTAIAVMVGLIIFPALFAIPGLQPTVGPKLIFMVLPNIFGQIPGGLFFAVGFFAMLTLAALTSAVSLLEVVVSYCMDTWRCSRRQAVVYSGLSVFLIGIPSALGFGVIPVFTEMPLVGGTFLDLMDFVFGKVCLAVTGLLVCLFVGWRWGTCKAMAGTPQPGWLLTAWRWLIRVICPLLIAAVIIGLLIQ